MSCSSTRTFAGRLVMLPEGGMDLVATLHGQVSTLVLGDSVTSLDQEIRI